MDQSKKMPPPPPPPPLPDAPEGLALHPHVQDCLAAMDKLRGLLGLFRSDHNLSLPVMAAMLETIKCDYSTMFTFGMDAHHQQAMQRMEDEQNATAPRTPQ